MRITSIGLGSAVFGTDRGNRLLPAWQFTFQGVADPAAVLAIASSAQFAAPPESLHRSSVGARLAPDGRHLTVSFVGAAAGSGPCTVDYAADQLASVTAVAIRVREIRHGTATTPATVGRTTLGPTSYTCPDVGYLRRVTILLDAQLGDRVLIDATTHGPVQITDWSAHP